MDFLSLEDRVSKFAPECRKPVASYGGMTRKRPFVNDSIFSRRRSSFRSRSRSRYSFKRSRKQGLLHIVMLENPRAKIEYVVGTFAIPILDTTDTSVLASTSYQGASCLPLQGIFTNSLSGLQNVFWEEIANSYNFVLPISITVNYSPTASNISDVPSAGGFNATPRCPSLWYEVNNASSTHLPGSGVEPSMFRVAPLNSKNLSIKVKNFNNSTNRFSTAGPFPNWGYLHFTNYVMAGTYNVTNIMLGLALLTVKYYVWGRK